MPRGPAPGAHATAHRHVVWLSVWFICSRAITLNRRRPVPVGAGHLSWARVSAFSFICLHIGCWAVSARRAYRVRYTRLICGLRGVPSPHGVRGNAPCRKGMNQKSRKKTTHTHARVRAYILIKYIYIYIVPETTYVTALARPPRKLFEKWVNCTQFDKYPLIV